MQIGIVVIILPQSGWLKCDDTQPAERVQDPGNKNNTTYFYERGDTFSEAATTGIASKSFNVPSKPVAVKKSATTTSTATSKTQNIQKPTKDAPSKTHFVPSKSSEIPPSKSTKAPSCKVFNLDKGQREAFMQTMSELQSGTSRHPTLIGKAETYKLRENLSKLCGVEHVPPPVTESPLITETDKRQKKVDLLYDEWSDSDSNLTTSTPPLPLPHLQSLHHLLLPLCQPNIPLHIGHSLT